jgi:hypothetical protein
MGDYSVLIPITGYVEVEVKADSEEEALNKAHEKAEIKDIVEWDFKGKCGGNVCSAIKQDVEIYKLED